MIDPDRTKILCQQSNEFTSGYNKLSNFKIDKKKTSDPNHKSTSLSDFVVDDEEKTE